MNWIIGGIIAGVCYLGSASKPAIAVAPLADALVFGGCCSVVCSIIWACVAIHWRRRK